MVAHVVDHTKAQAPPPQPQSGETPVGVKFIQCSWAANTFPITAIVKLRSLALNLNQRPTV